MYKGPANDILCDFRMAFYLDSWCVILGERTARVAGTRRFNEPRFATAHNITLERRLEIA